MVTTAYAHGAVKIFRATAASVMVQVTNQLEVNNDHSFDWFTLNQLSH